ncbi:hypothetical protein FJZ36_19245 [Candidatus Poribacteria bacterium]|nr:hypothetical protein [Candidatus Poribacteria bacterium]
MFRVRNAPRVFGCVPLARPAQPTCSSVRNAPRVFGCVIVLSMGVGAAWAQAPETPLRPRSQLERMVLGDVEEKPAAAQAAAETPATETAPAANSTALTPTLHKGMSKPFYLRNGNLLQGTIRDVSSDGVVSIETEDGTLRIPIADFLMETATITKGNGTRFRGEVLSEDAVSYVLLSDYGEVVINKSDIRAMDRFLGGRQVPEREQRQRFFQGEETLTNVFLDPTAFGLQERAFYISGLSIGFGFTDNFMLTTRMFDSFQGDINLSPHFTLFNRRRGAQEIGLGVGGRLSTRHDMRREYDRYRHFISGGGVDGGPDQAAPEIKDLLADGSDDGNMAVFEELYLALSWRDSLRNGRGKWGVHVGAKTNSLLFQERPDLKPGSEWEDFVPYRFWAALDYDMTKRVKFLVQVFADNSWRYVEFADAAEDYFDEETPGVISFANGTYRPVDIDLGFLIAPTDTFRIGAHFQNPYITFYWKIVQF